MSTVVGKILAMYVGRHLLRGDLRGSSSEVAYVSEILAPTVVWCRVL